MTRKRFIKFLMGHKVQRRQAERIARFYIDRYKYFEYSKVLKVIEQIGRGALGKE